MIPNAFILAGQAALILTTLSCVAMAVLWVVGTFKPVRWEAVNAPDRLFLVAVQNGHMVLHWDYFLNLGGDDPEFFRHANETQKTSTRRTVSLKRGGFYFTFLSPIPARPPHLRSYTYRFREFGFDLWLPMLLTTVGPIWFLIRWSIGPRRRMRRLRLGLCVKCGYDLIRNVSGVCPECGTPVPPQEPAGEE